jgi:NTP pyrophosphatase (non-canonical NTP hydrolase)
MAMTARATTFCIAACAHRTQKRQSTILTRVRKFAGAAALGEGAKHNQPKRDEPMQSFLKRFRNQNVERAAHYFDHPTDLVWWTNAIAGEAGEACNISKKISRGDYKSMQADAEARHALAVELADVITYCDLLLAKLGVDTEDILIEKFNVVSHRVSYPVTLAA